MNKSYALISLILLLSSGAKLFCMDAENMEAAKNLLAARYASSGHPTYDSHKETFDDRDLATNQSVMITRLSKEERSAIRNALNKVIISNDPRDTHIEISVKAMEHYINEWQERRKTLSVAESREVLGYVSRLEEAIKYLEKEAQKEETTSITPSTCISLDITDNTNIVEPTEEQKEAQQEETKLTTSNSNSVEPTEEQLAELNKTIFWTEKATAALTEQQEATNTMSKAEDLKNQTKELEKQLLEAKQKAIDAEKKAAEEKNSSDAKVKEAYYGLTSKKAEKSKTLASKVAEVATLEKAQQKTEGERKERANEFEALEKAQSNATEEKPFTDAQKSRMQQLQEQAKKDLQDFQNEETKLSNLRADVREIEETLTTVETEIEKLAKDNPELAKAAKASGCMLL